MMSRCGIRQWIKFVLILFSLCGNTWKLILQSQTLLLVFTNFYEEFGGGTRLAMPETIYAPDSLSLKPGSGATEGVLD